MTMVKRRCETPKGIIRHLEREELLHICYPYGPNWAYYCMGVKERLKMLEMC